MNLNLQNIIDNIIGLIDKVIPDGTEKLKIKLEIAKLAGQLKSPTIISVLTIMVYLVFQFKAIFVPDYLLSEWFYIDLTLLILVFAFQFGVPFKDLLKVIKDFLKKKKGK